jgi:AraC-like DNA-binding protein
MSLQTSHPQSAEDHVVRPIDVSGFDRRRLSPSKFPNRFGEDGMTLSLVHLDVTLAVEAHAVSLVDIALTVGFQTQAHFTTVFKRFAGDTPYQWRSAHLAQFTPLPRAGERLS